MQYRIDESGKGLVVGMFVTKPVALERNIYVIAQTGLRPQRRQPAMISCFNRFTESVTSNNAPIERDTVIVFGHIEIDGKLTVERYVEGLTFNVYKKGFVSACIDLD